MEKRISNLRKKDGKVGRWENAVWEASVLRTWEGAKQGPYLRMLVSAHCHITSV